MLGRSHTAGRRFLAAVPCSRALCSAEPRPDSSFTEHPLFSSPPRSRRQTGSIAHAWQQWRRLEKFLGSGQVCVIDGEYFDKVEQRCTSCKHLANVAATAAGVVVALAVAAALLVQLAKKFDLTRRLMNINRASHELGFKAKGK